MPHKDARRAVDIVLENLDIPAWPQLPNRSFLESMYVQYSEWMPCLKVDLEGEKIYFDTAGETSTEIEQFYQAYLANEMGSFAISSEYATGLEAFLERLRTKPRETISFLKGQVTGPITFGLTVTDEKRQPILYNETLRDPILKTLILKAKWQEQEFKKIDPKIATIIFFDEPYLRAYGSAYVSLIREDVINYLNECFLGVEGLTGVHCCGNTDWGLLLETGVDIISFDAYDYTESLALYPRELKKFFERGGFLAWGIVPGNFPTTQQVAQEDLESLLKLFEEKLAILVDKGFDKQELLERAFITPNCGTGAMSESLAEKTLQLTSDLSKALRQKYSLGEK